MYEDTSDKISDFSVLASLDTQLCRIQNKVVVIFKHFTQKCHTLRQRCWNALTLLIYPGVFCYFRAVPGASVYVHTASSPHLRRFKHRSDGGTFQTVIFSRRGGGERGGFCSSKTKMLDRGKLMCERELADRQCIVGSFPSFMFWESSTKKPAEAPQEGGGDNEKFDYLSCTLFSAIIHTRN